MKTQITSVKELLLPVNFSKFSKFLKKNSQAVLDLARIKKCAWLKQSVIDSIIKNNEYRLETISSSPVLSTDLGIKSLPKNVKFYGLLTGM